VPLPAEYRPTLTSTVDAMVALDGWGAGSSGAAAGVIDAQGTEWILSRFDGWHAAPPPRTSLTDRPGEHGAFDGPAFLTPRVLAVEGTAIAVDLASALRARDIVASVCSDDALLYTLQVSEPGRPTRTIGVRRSGETKTSPVHGNAFSWSLLLVAPDPRRYGPAQSQLVGLPQPSGGLLFPLVFPLVFGAGQSGGQMTLTNSGTRATWPTWQILGPVTGPFVTDTGNTGKQLAFDPTFSVPAGQTVTVDTDAKTVLLAGVSRRDRLFTAQWFPLTPGSTVIAFGSASGFDAAAKLTGTWKDAWT